MGKLINIFIERKQIIINGCPYINNIPRLLNFGHVMMICLMSYIVDWNIVNNL